MITSTALSQSNLQYRVTWLTDPNNPNVVVPTSEYHYGTMGINNKGQACYGYAPDSQSPFRPWVWLPSADYGLTAGFHDLTTLCDGECDFELPAIARDINLSGIVVGQSEGVDLAYDGAASPSQGHGVATVWTLDTFTSLTLGTLDPGSIHTASGCRAVNDQDPPLIVGDSTILRLCNLKCTPPDPPVSGSYQTYTGFTFVFDGQSSMTALDPSGSDSTNTAYDVNTPGSGSPLIPGIERCFETLGGPCTGQPGGSSVTHCLAAVDRPKPAVWLGNSTGIEIDMFDPNVFMWARGANNNGELVGFGDKTINDVCSTLPGYWPSYTSSIVQLPSTFDNTLRRARAVAINNLQLPKAVGWVEIVNLKAVLWEKTGSNPSDWSASQLDDLLFAQGGNHWEIRQAHDINDSNWIVAIARNKDTNAICTVLLTPYTGSPTCPSDMNGDGVVNVVDMLAVINAWGSCAFTICGNEDITGDGQVAVGDLLALIDAWGPCQTGDEEAPRTVSECEQRCPNAFPGGGNDYADCVERCVRALCETGQLPVSECD